MANKIFSERIKELREQRHLSMQELANHLNVSKSSVNMWENAGVVPREPVLKEISKAFDVSIDYLLGNTTKEQEKERIDNLGDIHVLIQDLLGNLSEEDFEKFIQLAELLFTLDPSKRIDNFDEKLRGFYYAVKEAKEYGAVIGRVPTQEDNIRMWEEAKEFEKLISENDDNENKQ